MRNPNKFLGQEGLSFLGVMLLILLIILLLLFGNFSFIYVSTECIDQPFLECVTKHFEADDIKDEGDAADTVTATGFISGEFKGEQHSVNVVLNFRLSGGEVTGTFSGDCDGKIRGSYTEDNNVIKGKGSGSCLYVMPASGTFSGEVNTETKTITTTAKGSAIGFSKEGSLTLTYK